VLIPRAALAEAAARLREAPEGLRVAAVEADLDPLDLVRAGAGAFAAAAFFSSPGGAAFAGLGTARWAAAQGPGRFGALDAALAALPPGVPAFIGFSFDPGAPTSADWEGFPAAAALLPQIGAVRAHGRSRLIVAVPPGAAPGAVLAAAATLAPPGPPAAPAVAAGREVPPAGEWRERVGAVVAGLGVGGLSKVVLARTLRVGFEPPPDAFDLVALLGERFPSAYAYGWQAGAAALVGASPELLVARCGARLTCRPLAGSARRGTEPEADRRLGEALLASPKEVAEHAFVVEQVVTALRPLTTALEVPPGPVIDRLPGVQHLATPITGSTEARLLALVEALHPTPAVGGVPRAAALEAIAAVEGIDRGWYAGGIGWADADGDGEVAVTLRGALLRGGEGVLYAGAGIVAGSDPAAEAAETDLKLGATLGLFDTV